MKLCNEKFKLIVGWESIEVCNDMVAKITGGRFSGPALSDAEEVQGTDFIDIDLTPQLLNVLDSYYIVRLSWKDVTYLPNGDIALGGATLQNKYLKEFHNFKNSDRFVIDTSNHQSHLHAHNLVYKGEVIREDSTPYRYGS